MRMVFKGLGLEKAPRDRNGQEGRKVELKFSTGFAALWPLWRGSPTLGKSPAGGLCQEVPIALQPLGSVALSKQTSSMLRVIG